MNKNKLTALIGTLLIHLVIVLFLFLFYLSLPKQEEEGGVPVMIGNVSEAAGTAEPYQLTEVDVRPTTLSNEPDPASPEPPLVTQADEPTIQVKKQPEKATLKKEVKAPLKKTAETTKPVQTQQSPQKTADEKAAEEAASRIAKAFGKGNQMGSRGESATGQGIQGSPEGNGNTGKTSGIGGYGTFDLNGRSLGNGSLPVPAYQVQDEGRVVVTIVVNPAGQVIRTSINKRTNTTNPALRRAAEEAAKRARFNAIDGVNDQTGTITYYFKLR